MELTQEEKQIICNLLSQISIPVSQASVVLEIIRKLQLSLKDSKEKKELDKLI